MTEVSRLAPAWQEINTPPSRSKALAALRASPLFNSADFSVYERLLYYSYVNHHKRRNSFRIGYRRLSEVAGVSMRYVKKALWKLRGAPYKGELAYEPWVAVKITGRSNMYQVLPLHDDIGTEAHREPLHEYVPLKCPSEGHPRVPLLYKVRKKQHVHASPSTSLSASPVLEASVDKCVDVDFKDEQHNLPPTQDPAIGIKTVVEDEESLNPESPEENTSLQRCIEEGMSDNFVTRGAHFKAYRMPDGAKLIDQKREWAIGNADNIGAAIHSGLKNIIAGRYTLLDKKTNAPTKGLSRDQVRNALIASEKRYQARNASAASEKRYNAVSAKALQEKVLEQSERGGDAWKNFSVADAIAPLIAAQAKAKEEAEDAEAVASAAARAMRYQDQLLKLVPNYDRNAVRDQWVNEGCLGSLTDYQNAHLEKLIEDGIQTIAAT